MQQRQWDTVCPPTTMRAECCARSLQRHYTSPYVDTQVVENHRDQLHAGPRRRKELHQISMDRGTASQRGRADAERDHAETLIR
jgi:hypothetical protein